MQWVSVWTYECVMWTKMVQQKYGALQWSNSWCCLQSPKSTFVSFLSHKPACGRFHFKFLWYRYAADIAGPAIFLANGGRLCAWKQTPSNIVLWSINVKFSDIVHHCREGRSGGILRVREGGRGRWCKLGTRKAATVTRVDDVERTEKRSGMLSSDSAALGSDRVVLVILLYMDKRERHQYGSFLLTKALLKSTLNYNKQ